MKKIISLTLALMLSLTLILCSCGEDETPGSTGSSAETPATPWDSAIYKENATIGQGSKTFSLVVSAYDKSITLTVKTDEAILGTALTKLNVIEGEQGPYGLYMKKVNGIVADFDVDETYWALYINGEYALTGIDSTEIVSGATYKLSREK